MILALFLISFSSLGMAASHHGACLSRLEEDSLKIIEDVQKDKDFQLLLTESFQKKEAALESHEFQETITTLRGRTLRAQASPQASQLKHQSENTPPAELTLFVSFSLGEKALLNLAHEAKLYGATLVLRGFKENSYAQTIKALQKIIQETGQGFIIDPELFSLFSVTTVPTTILSRPFQIHAAERTQTPLHDRLQGHVSIRYALEQFAKEGDLKKEARSLLENPGKGGSQ